ncbi:hypothetical protein QBC46DRAFT_19818 [Diplogelasinospora grovesii]|uniref:GYF domain-containing protein n=1 Tax=Diplogelasinospora grovesii TaxID=303347 RepID=A0AAN6N1S5_9PEZI|nr:hypothetical protein QBC46DRAFT_19818 [Diplogelasinospora grovesii]
MPSQLPSSFASAAAGQIRDSRGSGRSESVRGSGSGEWPRSNGTRTFRRQSTTPFNQSASANDASQNSASDVPPLSANAQSTSFDPPGSLRYSKDELLEIYRNTSESAQLDATSLFVPSWNPSHVNGASSRPWGKSGESGHVPQDPTICWDANGTVRPIGLEEISPEEREMFASDVNSTLKLPQQSKDGSHQGGGGQNGRKASISLGSASNNYPVSSPSTASRPGTRRRETTDTNPFPSAGLASPTGSGRFARDDPWLARRSNDVKEPISDEPDDEDADSRETPARNQPFGTLSRSNTTGPSGFGAASSLWGPSSSSTAAGVGAFGSFALPTSTIGDKRFGPGRGESRLAHLIPEKHTDNANSKPNDTMPAEMSRTWRPRQRTDTDPFAIDDGLSGMSGSAILGGAQDNSPPPHSSQLQRGGIFDTPVKGNTGDFGMAGLSLGAHGEANGPASPSETNPYRSPLAERGEDEHEDGGMDRLHQHPGPGSEQPSNFSTISRAFAANAFDGSDRSQTSSVGAKGFPPVNTLTGWPAGPSSGTPDRERQHFNNAFGGSIFSPLGDLQSPGLGGLGGVFGAPGASGVGRGSKLGSLFPPAMQAQMQAQDQDSLSDSVPDLRQGNPLGAIGRGAIGVQPRETDSPVRSTRGAFEDLFPTPDTARSPFTTAEQLQPGLTATSQAQSFSVTAGPSFSSPQPAGDPSAVRTMVMPDRMRWVYLDPQGIMQGPFSGLEMNDWYKAQFFTPDLRVKRLEDPDFEPLGQLIRRIGNSREPFLVPQMGIAHGPPSQTGPLSLGDSPGSAVPPLQNAFPTFGRTLTAQQQNDLERRKQEEQLFHARQRELAHHQTFGRLQMQPGVPGSLHHHSSAHSLQSQPSFGSMTSPIGMPPQPPIGAMAPTAGFFEAPGTMAQGPTQAAIGVAPDLFAPDLSLGERQILASMQGAGNLSMGGFASQPAGTSGSDSGSLRGQLPGVDQLQKDSEGFSARLKEFHELRAQRDAEEAATKANLPDVTEETFEHKAHMTAPVTSEELVSVLKETADSSVEAFVTAKKVATAQGNSTELSLTERVRKTQADAAAAAAAKPIQQPSASGLPMPFPPPPQSSTPQIAAPTAQRPASNLPTRYGERSASGTPDTMSDAAALAPPPTAPWAPQPGTETQRGPSLKEIQEAEAKKAAKKEEAVAAARRAALEQEAAALREREKAAAATNSGLPATSTWGIGSPVSAPATGSAWKQPAAAAAAAAKATTVGATSAASAVSKKTLADIQREEEVRKQKAKEAALQASMTSGSAMGKRYADLAGKSSAPPGLGNSAAPAAAPQATAGGGGGGWSTVGAGGKVKIPTGPAAQTRTVSATTVKSPAAPIASKPVSKQTNTGSKEAKGAAMEEFLKWLHRELARGLIGVADIDHFASSLLEMPLDPSILAEAVYSHSTTMDGRHFAEEFVRRKKLADKGVVEKQPVASTSSESKNSTNGGWNEVAKKGSSNSSNSNVNSSSTNSHKEEANIPGSNFRIVSAKRKGKK